jgi:hypothetical protein
MSGALLLNQRNTSFDLKLNAKENCSVISKQPDFGDQPLKTGSSL